MSTEKAKFPDGLGLAAPARRALTAAGITNFCQLGAISEKELMELHGMGPNALKRIQAALREAGMK